MFSVVIGEKGGAERRETYEQSEVNVGRVVGNELVLPKGNVSKRHCRFEFLDGRFVVTDLNSTNGTYVNRRRITQPTVVREGDRIYVGDFVLRLEPALADAPPSSLGVDLGSPIEPAMPTGPGEDLPPPPPAPALSAARAVRPDAFGVSTNLEEDDEASLEPPGEGASLINAVRFLVERVSAKLEPALLDREITDDVRRRVERLVEDVFNAMTSEHGMPADVQPSRVKEAASAELLDLGPLTALLDDPTLQELTVSGSEFISLVRGGQHSRAGLPFCVARSVQRALLRLCRAEGHALSGSEKVVHRELAMLGLEMTAITAQASSSGAMVRLRRRDPIMTVLDDLVQSAVLTREMASFLECCVVGRVNLLVVGDQVSTAAELLSALAGAAHEGAFALRGESELGYLGSSIFPLIANAEDLGDLFRAVQQFPSHHLVIDGLNGARVQPVLRALVEGVNGVIASVRARSVEHALAQLSAQLVLSSTLAHPSAAAVLSACFDVVVEVGHSATGPRVTRIVELSHSASSLACDDIYRYQGGVVVASEQVPRVARELHARGFAVDLSMFAPASR